MKLSVIYDQYSIPRNLRTHMLRVASLGRLICVNLSPTIKIDKVLLITSLLVHDMGNIVKFDFSSNLIKWSEDVAVLKKIQNTFITKYGSADHEVTENILKEIGVKDSIIKTTHEMTIEKLGHILKNKQWDLLVATYADYRIGPIGIISLDQRIDDLVVRNGNKPSLNWSSSQKVETYRKNLNKCEKIIQKYCSISLNSINDKTLENYFEDFLKRDII